jgi:hypothetical protein
MNITTVVIGFAVVGALVAPTVAVAASEMMIWGIGPRNETVTIPVGESAVFRTQQECVANIPRVIQRVMASPPFQGGRREATGNTIKVTYPNGTVDLMIYHCPQK